jgi:DNA-binding transcriptional LysR family regulator
MDIRQLRYAIAVAEELNFTRAARRCNVSQPPLSRAIQELEEEVGARLFERDKHSVRSTPAGESFIGDVRRALAVLEEGVDRARRVAAGYKGTLSVGIGGSTLYSLLPSLVRRFHVEAPDIRLEFSSMSVLYQIEALRAGEIDVGIVRLPVVDELIETQFVHSEALVVALPLGHRLLQSSEPIMIEQLASDRFITYELTRGFNFHADLLSLCRLASFDPDIVHQAPTTEAVIGIVACGEGVAIVPASAERLRMNGVGFRPLDLKSIPGDLRSVQFAIAWSRENRSQSVQAFVRCATNFS